MKWEIIGKLKNSTTKSVILNQKIQDITKCLLENRNIATKKEINEFINPKDPRKTGWKELGINEKSIKNVINRIKQAKDKKEKIVIFGDYDADGVCATAILWKTLYKFGYDVLPYIPNRFEEGYGFKAGSLEKLKDSKTQMPSLIITVDNGIVAYDAIKAAKKLGIDVIVVDHHTKGDKKLNTKYVIHSTAVCGSALTWLLSREISYRFGTSNNIEGSEPHGAWLELATIGTVADQMPLLGINRSIVKFGLNELNKTKNIGLKELIKQSEITKIGVYEIGFIIAPRINASGRLTNAIDSLRLLCTENKERAVLLAKTLNQTNLERQKIVGEVLKRVLEDVSDEEKVIILSGEYHEGVIGLASGKVTEKLYKPSIIFSKGEKISKASARSISGFNIIEAIKETGLILEGGGHPMAAGFSIYSKKIEEFKLKINELSKEKLTDELLERKLKIDMEIDFENITKELANELQNFEPFGNGNYPPVFATSNVKVVEVKTVGADGKHLKLKLSQGNKTFDAIWFNANKDFISSSLVKADIAFTVEENVWNNKSTIQLNIKDVRI